jgi:hypothetical protein
MLAAAALIALLTAFSASAYAAPARATAKQAPAKAYTIAPPAVRRASAAALARRDLQLRSLRCGRRVQGRRASVSWRCTWRAADRSARNCNGNIKVVRSRRAHYSASVSGRRCAAAPAAGQSQSPSGTAAVPRTAALFGFNDDAAKRGAITPDQEADLAARAGATIERIPLAWGWIEYERGQFDWSVYDGLYAAYQARGIRPLWAVQSPSGWAAQGTCPAALPNCVLPPKPQYDGDWRAFLTLLAARYPASAAIEVWNEPNSSLYWGGAPDPVRYAQVVRLARDGVRAADPSMPVVLGGLADVSGAAGMPAADFLSALYAQGIAGVVDGIGYHPYAALPDTAGALRRGVQRVRAVRDGAGDRTPLWITETGASEVGEPAYPPYLGAAQATGLTTIYRELAAMPDVAAIVLHRLIDAPPGNGLESGFGLVGADLAPKPAYCAIALLRGRACG